MVAFKVQKEEKAFVNYVLDAGLLDKEEIRRLCIAKKKFLEKKGKVKHLAQLAIDAAYLTKEQAQAILATVKQEEKEAGPEEYEQSIDGTLELYGVDLEKIVLEQNQDFSKPEERYIKIREVGRGGMGVVDQALDNVLHREVAKKTILLTSKAKGDKEKLKAEVIKKTQRAKNEARLTGKLSHPYIIKVHDSGRDSNNNFFYVMEYVENGKELTDVIDQITDIKRKGKKLPNKFAVDSVLEMVAQVCDGMDYAHKQGVIHRDLKPENIMVYGSADKLFMLIVDWGLAKDVEKRELLLPAELSDEDLKEKLKTAIKGRSQEIRTEDGQVMGTLKYMAPEQALGAEKTDAKSDIFSLGAILYETLTGQSPRDLQGKNVLQALNAIAQDDIEDARNVKASLFNITPGLAAICAKAMDINPKKRYKSAGQMARDLRNYLEYKELIAKPDGFFAKWYKRAIRNPLKAGAAITAAILLPLALGGVGVVRGISAQNELILEKDKTVAERTAKEEAKKAEKSAKKAAKSEKARAEAERKEKEAAEGRAESEKGRADLAERLKNLSERKRNAILLVTEGLQITEYARAIKDTDKQRKKLEEAVEVFTQAIGLDDTLAHAYNNRGLAYALIGSNDTSLQDYNRAIALDPKLGKAYNGRGALKLLRLSDLDGAILDFEESKKHAPLMLSNYLNLAVCYIRKNNYDRAIENCDLALDINPQNNIVLRNKGESYLRLGRYKKAEKSLKKAVTFGHVFSNVLLAETYVEAANSGNPLYSDWQERAREHCARAVSIDPRLAKEAKEILEKIK